MQPFRWGFQLTLGIVSALAAIPVVLILGAWLLESYPRLAMIGLSAGLAGGIAAGINAFRKR